MRIPTSRLAAGLAALIIVASVAPAQPLAGAYTVGPAGAYPNVAAALAALTANGVSAPVTFNVLANDAGPWTLGTFPGQGPANPVLFDGGGTVTLSGTTPLLTLGACANVTFAGFSGTFAGGMVIVVSGAATDCRFRGLNFSIPPLTSGGSTVFSITGGTNTTVEQCTFGGGEMAFDAASGSTGTTIERCRITTGGRYIGRLWGPNATFRNNFVYGNVTFGLQCGISGTGGGTSATNLKIQHNSFYMTHPAGGTQYDILRWYSSATPSEVTNNIFYDVHPGATGFVMWCSGTLRPQVMNYNVYNLVSGVSLIFASANQTFASWQGLGFDLNSIVADPTFVNISSTPPDLHLTSGSPALSAGTTIPSVTVDFDGNPRSTPVDIGAHELTSGNILSLVTSGGGAGDLVMSLGSIHPAATEGFTLLSLNTAAAVGTGPIVGLWTDALTWQIISYPLIPGSPFHFPTTVPGVFPAAPFAVPPGTLSALAGLQMDAVAVLFGPGFGYLGASNVVRVAW